jgi:hypothetical protein
MISKLPSCVHFSAAVAVGTVVPLLPTPPTMLHAKYCPLEGMEILTPTAPLLCETGYMQHYQFLTEVEPQYKKCHYNIFIIKIIRLEMYSKQTFSKCIHCGFETLREVLIFTYCHYKPIVTRQINSTVITPCSQQPHCSHVSVFALYIALRNKTNNNL